MLHLFTDTSRDYWRGCRWLPHKHNTPQQMCCDVLHGASIFAKIVENVESVDEIAIGGQIIMRWG